MLKGFSSFAAVVGAVAAGGWSPLDLDALSAWWDFSDAATVFEDTDGTDAAEADDSIAYVADKSGSGLHLTQATADMKPVYKTNILNGQAVGRLDGGDSLAKATVFPSALVTADAGTFAGVVKQSGSNANNALLNLNATTPANGLTLYATFGDSFYYDHGSTSGGSGRMTVAQPAGWDNTWHIVIFWRNGTHGQIWVDGGESLTTGNYSDDLDIASNSGTLVAGNHVSGAAGFAGDIAEIIVCNDGLDWSDINTLGNHLASKYGLTWTTASYSFEFQIVCEGDSLTIGVGVSAADSYPSQLRVLLGDDYAVVNDGDPSDTIEQLGTTELDALQFSDGAVQNVLVVWGGTNDMYFGQSGAGAYADLVGYCQARQSAGWTVLVLTCLPRSGGETPGDFETQRSTFNTNIVSNWATFADALVDVAADDRIGDAGDELNTTYYQADMTHMTAAGYAIIADLVRDAILLL